MCVKRAFENHYEKIDIWLQHMAGIITICIVVYNMCVIGKTNLTWNG